jgi:serine/threonine protein kinase
MHAAGVTAIKDVPTLGFSEAQRKKIFAEFVASVHALHTVDLTHNDLHGQNIVLKGDQLALIDFGSLKTLARSWKKDYKRDGSAIWRWGAVLAGCPENAQWPNPPTSSAGSKFLECMKKFSNGDAAFMGAMKNVVNGAVMELNDHGVKALYSTPFIQSNMPALKRNYPWEGEGDCLQWSAETWLQFEFDENFPGYVKCDTLPSYTRTKTRTKRGKTRSTVITQCEIPGMEFQSACWHRNTEKIWACGGCGGGVVTIGFAGGCLLPSHPQYKFASDA